MRTTLAAALAAGLLVGACGGGQTDTTEAEEALNNGLQPMAPAPGGAGNAAGAAGAGNQSNMAGSSEYFGEGNALEATPAAGGNGQ